MLKRLFKNKVVWLMITILAFIYLNNTSLFVNRATAKPLIVAHRGVHQTFPMEGITGDTNTAQRIYPPEHPYLENTIASMERAFQLGADIVEFDVQLTKDGQFAVFHDWQLELRTNGKGNVREHTMAELTLLDIGYGYTADNGQTFPFRGKGIGLMPTLTEVLGYFPDRSFLIHIKSNDLVEGERLAEYLRKLPEDRLAKLTVYGGVQPIAILQEKLPQLRVMSKQTMKNAILPYIAIGWTGYVPKSMRNAHFVLPLKYSRILWGWPHRFIERIEKVDTQFIVVLGDGKWSEGFDRVEDLDQLPSDYNGGIWTNRIDRIGPVLRMGYRE